MWGLIELIAPVMCAGCGLPGTLLCDGCRETLPLIAPALACPWCGGERASCGCAGPRFAFSQAIAVGRLEGSLARAIVIYKDGGERRAGALLGSLLADALAPWRGWPDVVAGIPPTRESIARRGFDHTRVLTEWAARAVGRPPDRLLVARRRRDQRRLDRDERQRNAAGSFAVNEHAGVPGTVLLIDDVMTTGATLDAAARALLDAGAREVRAAVLARA